MLVLLQMNLLCPLPTSDVDETPTGTTGIDGTTTGGNTTGGTTTGGITSLGFIPVNDFNHPAEIVADVISLLQSTSNNSAYYERVHLIMPMVSILPSEVS